VTSGPIYEVGAEYLEQLNYSNPFQQTVFPAWHRNQRYYCLETVGPVALSQNGYHESFEFHLRYGAPDNRREEVPGQWPILNTIPGSVLYVPIRQIVWVFVPDDYQANSLRSEEAIRKSSYPIIYSGHFRNHPTL